MTDPNTPSTKTRYIRDPRNPDRVLTLVTKVSGNNLQFAVAVNSPPRTITASTGDGGMVTWQVAGDRFARKIGSRIAHGRLDCERSRTEVIFDPKTQHPLIAALSSLIVGENMVAARIAMGELEHINDQGGLKPAGAADVA